MLFFISHTFTPYSMRVGRLRGGVKVWGVRKPVDKQCGIFYNISIKWGVAKW